MFLSIQFQLKLYFSKSIEIVYRDRGWIEVPMLPWKILQFPERNRKDWDMRLGICSQYPLLTSLKVSRNKGYHYNDDLGKIKVWGRLLQFLPYNIWKQILVKQLISRLYKSKSASHVTLYSLRNIRFWKSVYTKNLHFKLLEEMG